MRTKIVLAVKIHAMDAMEGILVEAVEANVVSLVEAKIVDDGLWMLWRLCLCFGDIAEKD